MSSQVLDFIPDLPDMAEVMQIWHTNLKSPTTVQKSTTLILNFQCLPMGPQRLPMQHLPIGPQHLPSVEQVIHFEEELSIEEAPPAVTTCPKQKKE